MDGEDILQLCHTVVEMCERLICSRSFWEALKQWDDQHGLACGAAGEDSTVGVHIGELVKWTVGEPIEEGQTGIVLGELSLVHFACAHSSHFFQLLKTVPKVTTVIRVPLIILSLCVDICLPPPSRSALTS